MSRTITSSLGSSRKARQYTLQILEPRQLLAVDPVISEFMASNQSTIADSDGDFSDWLEIHNADTTPIELGGWYISDDATNLTRWQVPAGTTIAAGDHLLVYASGKDRGGEELHTNFKISSQGEYLALVKPDGATVTHSYDSFPAQQEDISYGLAPGREVTELISKGHDATAFVPTDDSLGLDWTAIAFDDSNWKSGGIGIGYEELAQGLLVHEDFSSPLGPEWTIDNPGPATVTMEGGKLILDVPTGVETESSDRGSAPIIYRDVPPFAESEKIPTNWSITTHVVQSDENRGAAGLTILDGENLVPVIKLQYRSRTNFEFRVDEDRKHFHRDSSEEEYFLRIERNGTAKAWTAFFRLTEEDAWTRIGTVTEGVDDVPVIRNPKPAIFAATPSSTMNAQFDFITIDVEDEPPVYTSEIGLDVGNELKDQNSSIFARIPFNIEGSPTQFEEITMNLRFDDGYRAYLNGELISEENAPFPPAPPAANLVPWDAQAQGTHGASDGIIPVTQIDLTEMRDRFVTGQNVLAVHGLNISADDTDFFFDSILFGSDFVAAKAQQFVRPTPGELNQVPAASSPIIIGQQGVFFDSTTVELQFAESSPELEIRYTLDGSDPTKESRLYSRPILLTESAMLQARSFGKSDDNTIDPSPISSGTFVAADPNLRDRTSDIPIVLLDTLDQRLTSAGSTSLTSVNVVALEVSRASGRAGVASDVVDYIGRGGIRDRGSSTAGQPKPNLAFETWGASGNDLDDDENVPLLGFSSESDWVLHAPHNFDRAMIRNQLAYDLSNQMGQWAPKTRAVEVYLNRDDGIVTESDYMGVYVLTEKIIRDPGRLDIEEVTPEDNAEPEISGGYIWKVDRTDPDAGTFPAGGLALNWVEPKSPNSRTARDDQKATLEQQTWVQDHFREVQQLLRDADINDPEGYSKYIDVRAWVDHHLVSVFMDDVDAFALSAYLHKDRNGKIKAGPTWDFDRSAESLDGRDDDPTRWGGSGASNFFSRMWYSQLFRDPGFWQAYVDRWTELRRTTLSEKNLDATIDKLAGEVEESQERNYLASPNRSVRPRTRSSYASGKLDGTWQGEVEHMRAWLHERLQFFDSNFAQPPAFKIDGQIVPKVDPETLIETRGIHVSAGQQIEIEGPSLSFFDDLPIILGEPGAVTGTYFSPSDDSLGTDWTQNNFDDSAWQSGPLAIGFSGSESFQELIRSEFRPVEGGTTILIRIPFEVTDLSVLDDRDLFLKAKYDDGFVAYLNGTEVLRQNLRDPDAELTWNSRAASHTNSEAVKFEGFDLSEFENLLTEGTNLLAIRAINGSSTSTDMLMLPELAGRREGFGANPRAKVYYTIDGSDPRGPDGMPSESSFPVVFGETVTINQNTRIIARNFDDQTDRGQESSIVRTDWSAPIEFNFTVTDADLVVSEINYNPSLSDEDMAAGWTSADFEFVEVQNVGDTAADLTGVAFTDGIEFDFLRDGTVTTMEPGSMALVVANKEAFEHRYGENLPIAGVFSGNLANNGEDIDLISGTGDTIFSVNYSDSDPWPVRADGAGATLALANATATPTNAQSKWYNWEGSVELGGSPGAIGDDSSGVVINEIIANPAGDRMTDSIELLNVSDTPVDISGWHLSDDLGGSRQFAIPAGTVLLPGEYIVFDQSDLPFGLSGTNGDDVWLFQQNEAGNITRFEDDIHFGGTRNGESLGRAANSLRPEPLLQPTFDTSNSAPRVGPVVISEIQYNPVVSEDALAIDPSLVEGDLEFIEIHNPTDTTVDLSRWRIRGGVDFDFPSDVTLASGTTLVVMRFNPDDPENINRLNAFKAHYAISDGVRLIGGYRGQLNNSDDRVTLRRAEFDVPEEANSIYHTQEDEVLYDDQPPWPANADGTGNSLNRRSLDAFGNDGKSFFAAPASPGRVGGEIEGDFDGNGILTAADIDLLFAELRAAVPDLRFDLTADGRVDENDRNRLVKDIFKVNYGDANLDGIFNSSDLVLIFQRGEYEDGVAGNSGWEDGDWDGDGDFTTRDFVFAFRDGGYVKASKPARVFRP